MNRALDDLGILGCEAGFLARVTESLWMHPSDFQLALQRLQASQKTLSPLKAAGVLVPLLFRRSAPGKDSREGQFVFQLIKRSSYVPQPGDLSCPGGMIHPLWDRLLRLLLIHGPFSIVPAPVPNGATMRNVVFHRVITLFLTSALRESWEEIRLPPCRVRFLGPLPTYSLTLFRRMIFPLVAYVKQPVSPRLNREVEKIVEIPLSSFYREELFGCYTLIVPGPSGEGMQPSLQFPCLIHREPEGTEEVLWGATFHILVQFLRIVMDYRLPNWKNGHMIQRKLDSDYRTGRAPS
jgi:hypothetical protein